jgi:hypothetical protein
MNFAISYPNGADDSFHWQNKRSLDDMKERDLQ